MIATRIENPIFLVGAERSGTTLLRLMLDGHPQLAFLFESEFIVDLVDHPTRWPKMEAYCDYLMVDRVFQLTGFTIDRALSYPALMNSFLHQKRVQSNKPLVGATVHRHFDRLLRIWPNARFIHLIRDGRDVARSNIDMGWAGNVWTGAERWVEAEELWQKLRPRMAAEQFVDVRYEDLVREPIPTLTRICQFIGIEYDSGLLEYPRHTSYELPNPKMIGQWKRKLSEDEIRLAEARIGPMLVERDYPLSGLPPMEVTRAMQRQLQRQDHWWRVKFRLKRQGWWLFLADLFSRRLHLRPLRRAVKMRLNAVDALYVK